MGSAYYPDSEPRLQRADMRGMDEVKNVPASLCEMSEKKIGR